MAGGYRATSVSPKAVLGGIPAHAGLATWQAVNLLDVSRPYPVSPIEAHVSQFHRIGAQRCGVLGGLTAEAEQRTLGN
jgi:hypothetical protein